MIILCPPLRAGKKTKPSTGNKESKKASLAIYDNADVNYYQVNVVGLKIPGTVTPQIEPR